MPDEILSLQSISSKQFAGVYRHGFDIKQSTFEKYFKKALTGDTAEAEALDDPITNEVQHDFVQLRQVSSIQELMDLNSFLNPADEDIRDDREAIDERIIAQLEPTPEEDSDEEVEFHEKIPLSEAIEALRKLRLYEEQQDEGYQPILREFDQFERILLARRVNNAVQKDIRGYFQGDSI
ncbi:hypothetical protein VTN77DRAFT_1018 [Rasamsonia byssochlamydoides]|uniref:uncharacterized protein n=1 Tax=Rasamsonia byssochlamydoides TaxID=89139 RepID=UPI0037422103